MEYNSSFEITFHSIKGDKLTQEDSFFCSSGIIANTEQKFEYVGIFDGHDGKEAALYARENLLKNILKQPGFISGEDDGIIKSIEDGFLETQMGMLEKRDDWKNQIRIALPGAAVAVAFIMNDSVYTGNVGDSSINLGFKVADDDRWRSKILSRNHSLDQPEEREFIGASGGTVFMNKYGKYEMEKSLGNIKIFHNNSHGLGDLWSYDENQKKFLVSPKPYCSVSKIDKNIFKCLILSTAGLEMPGHNAVKIVQRTNELQKKYRAPRNPSEYLIKGTCSRIYKRKKADNMTAITVMFNYDENDAIVID